jgi:phage baseplate assembly protein W
MDAPVAIASLETADWQPALGAIGSVVQDGDDIDQCIRTILSTAKGSVPHEPDFGCDLWMYLDWPVEQARPFVIREILDAINTWEPRVEVTQISFDADPDDSTTAVVQITRRRRNAADTGAVLVLRIPTQ